MPLDFKFGLTWRYGEKRGSFTLFHRPFKEAMRDWSPAFAEIASDVLEPRVKEAFKTEGAADGKNWQALAPATVKARGSAHPILHVTGGLEQSFQKGGEGHVENIGLRKLVWGSSKPTALFHEFGTGGKVNFGRSGARKVIRKSPESRVPSPGPKGIPARPMLVYSTQFAQDIGNVMLGRIAMVARQIGYRVTNRPGEATASPLEARKIGQALLGGNIF